MSGMGIANPSNETIAEVLKSAKTIAVVGLSDKPDRTSYMVAAAMQARGYRIIPVNPMVTGEILGERCYPSLKEVPVTVDIVNVFRRSEQVMPVAEETVAIGAKCFWLQQEIYNEQAAELVQQHEITVIMNLCIKVAHAVLIR
jgi:predicted CoA-binding protein